MSVFNSKYCYVPITGLLEQNSVIHPEPWRTEYVIMIALLVVLVLFSLIIMAILYRKSLKKRIAESIPITNENTAFAAEKPAPTIDLQPSLTNDIDSAKFRKSSNGIEETSILPQWLLKRKEMIFSHMYIEQQEKLGSGQFGTVYKGRLRQGNAV